MSDGIRHECHECGLQHRLPPLPHGASAYCSRCGALLHRRRPDPWRTTLPLALATLPLLPVIVLLPFITLTIGGQEIETRLLAGPAVLEQDGLTGLALLVLATSFLIPLLKLGSLCVTLIGLRLGRPPRFLPALFRSVGHLSHWAMVEVFLLAVIVAYTKLVAMAQVEIGLAAYALVALMVLMAAIDASLDERAVWDEMERRGLGQEPAPGPPDAGSLQQSWALVVAAAILYVPANLYPVMVVTSLGTETRATILEGVRELATGDTWPLAVLVFFASITVPCLKLIGLVYMLIATGRGSAARLRDRARLYRVIEFVGRWSMIDVFMVSILASLVDMGAVVSIGPGVGAVAFASVVVLTMIAALTFDPRLMWRNAEEMRG
jgi:paraquat-inducible protein A